MPDTHDIRNLSAFSGALVLAALAFRYQGAYVSANVLLFCAWLVGLYALSTARIIRHCPMNIRGPFVLFWGSLIGVTFLIVAAYTPVAEKPVTLTDLKFWAKELSSSSKESQQPTGHKEPAQPEPSPQAKSNDKPDKKHPVPQKPNAKTLPPSEPPEPDLMAILKYEAFPFTDSMCSGYIMDVGAMNNAAKRIEDIPFPVERLHVSIQFDIPICAFRLYFGSGDIVVFLLLPQRDHSDLGLMRGEWTADDLRITSSACLGLPIRSVQFMQKEALRRVLSAKSLTVK